jgi:hypothetical protein
MSWNYSRFEGLTTQWRWLDSLFCLLFGHPRRSYFLSGSIEVCAQCVRPRL